MENIVNITTEYVCNNKKMLFSISCSKKKKLHFKQK